MTSTRVPTANPFSPSSRSSAGSIAERRLRLVLGANATTSAVFGLVGAVGASPVAELLGVEPVWLVRLVSIGLVLFSVDVALTARAATPRLITGARLVSLADWSWVGATVVVLAAGVLTSGGALIMGLIGLGVADFAILQLVFRRRLLAT